MLYLFRDKKTKQLPRIVIDDSSKKIEVCLSLNPFEIKNNFPIFVTSMLSCIEDIKTNISPFQGTILCPSINNPKYPINLYDLEIIRVQSLGELPFNKH